LTTNGTKTPSIIISGLSANTNRVFVGDESVSSTNYFASLAANGAINISAVDFGLGEAMVDLSSIWVDVTTDGEGFMVGYLDRVEGD
jgi:hypothetical protein